MPGRLPPFLVHRSPPTLCESRRHSMHTASRRTQAGTPCLLRQLQSTSSKTRGDRKLMAESCSHSLMKSKERGAQTAGKLFANQVFGNRLELETISLGLIGNS